MSTGIAFTGSTWLLVFTRPAILVRPALTYYNQGVAMNKIVFAIVFVVVTAGMFVVCANAHIDFFPCEITEHQNGFEGPLRTREGTCSLLAHNRPEMNGERERLTGAGWAMLVAFCAGIGLAAGVALGLATKKKG